MGEKLWFISLDPRCGIMSRSGQHLLTHFKSNDVFLQMMLSWTNHGLSKMFREGKAPKKGPTSNIIEHLMFSVYSKFFLFPNQRLCRKRIHSDLGVRTVLLLGDPSKGTVLARALQLQNSDVGGGLVQQSTDRCLVM